MDKTKRIAIIGAVAGILAAGFRRRQRVELSIVHAGPASFTVSEWKQVASGTKQALADKNLSTLAAGVAYYSTLAFFPFLAAAVALAALLITPQQLNELVGTIESYLPGDISKIIVSQLHALVTHRTGNALAAIIAIIVALVSASGASKNLIIASNVAYGVKESRGWLVQQLWGVAWTAAGIAVGFVFVVLLAINRTILHHLGLPETIVTLVLYGRWLVIILGAITGLAVFYRYGPDRSKTRWRWVGWGATIATLVWLAGTVLFFVYVQNFANYAQSYSLFAGIIVLMIWLNLSALIVLLGAEINHQIEVTGGGTRIPGSH